MRTGRGGKGGRGRGTRVGRAGEVGKKRPREEGQGKRTQRAKIQWTERVT